MAKKPDDLTRRQMLRRSAGWMVAGSAAGGIAVSPEARAADGEAEPTGLGVLGAAHIHVEQCAQMIELVDGVAVRAIYDDDAALAERARERMGGDVAVSPAALLGREDVDAVVVLSENVKHADYAVAAAEAGKPVFVEKPLAVDPAEARRIAEAVQEAGVPFQTGYFLRSQGHLRFLREAIREGKLGQVTRLRLQYTHAGSLEGWWDGDHAWMAELDQVGRGALGDLGIHVLDALLWITQGDPLVGVAAHVGNATGAYGGIDEFGEAIFRFESGLVATIAAGYVDYNDANRLEVSGTEGHAHITRGQLRLTCPGITGEEGETPWRDFEPSLEHPFELYLRALRGAEVPLVPVEEAARDVEVMAALYRAAERGEWVTWQAHE